MRRAARWRRWSRHRALAGRLAYLDFQLVTARDDLREAQKLRALWRDAERDFRAPLTHLSKTEEPVARRWANLELLQRLAVSETALLYYARTKNAWRPPPVAACDPPRAPDRRAQSESATARARPEEPNRPSPAPSAPIEPERSGRISLAINGLLSSPPKP